MIRIHKDSVYRQLLRMCGNREDAEDVLSESLLKAFKAIDQLDEREQFKAWLVQIGRRTCGRLKKRQAMLPFVNWSLDEANGSWLADPAASQEDQVLEGELKECITTSFDSMPSKYREIYRLRVLEDLSAEVTAKMLGITVANVKSRLHRARNMLRERIDSSLGK